MSRTKRIYNKPNRIRIFRPYGEVCCGNCKACKKYKEDKKKTLKRKELKFEFGIF